MTNEDGTTHVEREANYWQLMAPENIRDIVEDDRFVGIGFVDTALGDLADYSREELASSVEGVYEKNPKHAAGQLWRFVHEIKQGDYVLVVLIGRGLFHIGQVTGAYTYNPSEPMPHRRSVKWFCTNISKDVLSSGLAQAPVQNADRHREIIDHLLSEVEAPDDPLKKLTEELFLSEPDNFLHEIKALLNDKKQVIFQGPPGTGKTYVAQTLAKHLAGSEELVTIAQFHPSYAYEDFVQGFRPALVNGQPGFELKDGPLLRAAKRAREEPDADYFLIIDEINRGKLASVFGELYFLLEYRDQVITLQYQRDQNEKISLPSNLYIIGTMNTADRSIALVDLALRRRFYFVEFHPDDEPVRGVLRRWLEANDMTEVMWVADVVERANELLKDDRHAAIGPSYFMKDGLDDAMVERIWKHSVLPYIEERRFGGDEVSDDFDLAKLKVNVKADSGSTDGEGDANNQDGGISDASD